MICILDDTHDVQVDTAQGKLHALADIGHEDDLAAAQVSLACLQAQLQDQQAKLACASTEESKAHAEVSSAEAEMEALDVKATRLKQTGESLAQGIAQMVTVRQLRSEALHAKQQEQVQKELCQQKRKESSQLQREVRTCRLASL